jgi:hypothetical protein
MHDDVVTSPLPTYAKRKRESMVGIIFHIVWRSVFSFYSPFFENKMLSFSVHADIILSVVVFVCPRDF